MEVRFELGKKYRVTCADGREFSFEFTGGPTLTVNSDDESIKTLYDIGVYKAVEEL